MERKAIQARIARKEKEAEVKLIPEVYVSSAILRREKEDMEGIYQSWRRGPRVVGGEDYVAVTTLTHVRQEDKLVFVKGEVTKGTYTFVQVDGGSEISCILHEHVAALGLEGQMMRRSSRDERRVRGIGMDEGEGEVITHDVWLSIAVDGREVDGWETSDVVPIEGGEQVARIEGWFAVLDSMSVPVLLGGDLLEEFDVITRPKIQRVILECKAQTRMRVSIPTYTLGAVCRNVQVSKDLVHSTPVWRDMIRMSQRPEGTAGRHFINRARIPPMKMKVVKVRYTGTGQVSERALSGVQVVSSSLRTSTRADQRSSAAWAVGWEPTKGLVCHGHPTVMIYNMTDQWLEVEPTDVEVEVVPLQEVTQYLSTEEYLSAGVAREVRVNSVGQAIPGEGSEHGSEKQGELLTPVEPERAPVERPEDFPEKLWDLLSPSDQEGLPAQFALY
jgi:hypothetical protein